MNCTPSKKIFDTLREKYTTMPHHTRHSKTTYSLRLKQWSLWKVLEQEVPNIFFRVYTDRLTAWTENMHQTDHYIHYNLNPSPPPPSPFSFTLENIMKSNTSPSSQRLKFSLFLSLSLVSTRKLVRTHALKEKRKIAQSLTRTHKIKEKKK